MKLSKAFLLTAFAFGLLSIASSCFIGAAEMPIEPNNKTLSAEEFVASLFAAVSIPDYELFADLIKCVPDPKIILSTFHSVTGDSLFVHALSTALNIPQTEYYLECNNDIARIINSLILLATDLRGSSFILNNSDILHRAIIYQRQDLIKIMLRFGRPLFTLLVDGCSAFHLAERSSLESIREDFKRIRQEVERSSQFLQIYPFRSLNTILGLHVNTRDVVEPIQVPEPDTNEFSGLTNLFNERPVTRRQVRFGSIGPALEDPTSSSSGDALFTLRRTWIRPSEERPFRQLAQPRLSEQARLNEEEQHQALLRELQEDVVAQEPTQGAFKDDQERDKSLDDDLDDDEVVEDVSESNEEEAFIADSFPVLPIASFPLAVLLFVFNLIVKSN